MKPFPSKIGEVLKKLRSARDELQAEYPGLTFELDGNLIGDIGEAIAISDLGLKKLPAGTKSHDCETICGKKVQVKTTQQKNQYGGVGLGLTKKSFDHLVVIRLLEDGYEVLYNGPGTYIDEAREGRASASLTVGQLIKLDGCVNHDEKLPFKI